MWWVALLVQPPSPPHQAPSALEALVAEGAPGAAASVAADDATTGERLRGLALWALQFTPRVSLMAAEGALLMELAASLRLFGGRRALHERLVHEAHELGASHLAWAPTRLAALVFARAGVGRLDELVNAMMAGSGAEAVSGGMAGGKGDAHAAAAAHPERSERLMARLAERLDRLPMGLLPAVQPHAELLARMGCRTLGDLRRLPRGGLARRFDAALLQGLDEAYGLVPEAATWFSLPEGFTARLELPARVELAAALLFGARRLLLQLCGWLAARQAGVTAFTLAWRHDALRARAAGEGGSLSLRTAAPSRDLEHLCRLLAEHLARVQLAAPVGELQLVADEVQPLALRSASLLPDDPLGQAAAESLPLVLERLAARLGPQRVLRPERLDDHRLEWMQMWRPAAPPPASSSSPSAFVGTPTRWPLAGARPDWPEPTWVLPESLPLATRGHRPLHQGALLLLSGPHRVEGGWWHRLDEAPGRGPQPGEGRGQALPAAPEGAAAERAGEPAPGGRTGETSPHDRTGPAPSHGRTGPTSPHGRTGHVQRDYWLALSEHAGALWIFQERLAEDQTAWFLHGVFG